MCSWSAFANTVSSAEHKVFFVTSKPSMCASARSKDSGYLSLSIGNTKVLIFGTLFVQCSESYLEYLNSHKDRALVVCKLKIWWSTAADSEA